MRRYFAFRVNFNSLSLLRWLQLVLVRWSFTLTGTFFFLSVFVTVKISEPVDGAFEIRLNAFFRYARCLGSLRFFSLLIELRTLSFSASLGGAYAFKCRTL